ncbi:MAG: hypothetical protein ABGW50_00910, partial [Thermococcus sp.]
MKIGTGDGGALEEGNAVPRGKEGQPPVDISAGVGGQADLVVEASGGGGQIDEAAEEEAARLDHLRGEREVADEGKQLAFGTVDRVAPRSKEGEQGGELVRREAHDALHGIDLNTEEDEGAGRTANLGGRQGDTKMSEQGHQQAHVRKAGRVGGVAEEEIIEVMEDALEGEDGGEDPVESIGEGVENEGRRAETEGRRESKK